MENKVKKVHFSEVCPEIAGIIKSIVIDGIEYQNLDFPAGVKTEKVLIDKSKLKEDKENA